MTFSLRVILLAGFIGASISQASALNANHTDSRHYASRHADLRRRADLWTSGFIGRAAINAWDAAKAPKVNAWDVAGSGKSPPGYITGGGWGVSGSGGGSATPVSYNKDGLTAGSTLRKGEQCGNSKWGSLDQGSLPSSYGGGSSSWGGYTTANANPYTSAPRTGITRYYHFTLAHCNIRPDGVQTDEAICINGQFPGPLIEANWGDTISVKVTNSLPDEGTSVHWHGFLQTNNCQADGVPGVTQCPIAPGASYTYVMKAELYGSSWYHSHYSAQYSGGPVGPIVVYGPWNSAYDIDVGPVMLMEWYRKNYMTNVRDMMRSLKNGGPILPMANSNLINGKMQFPCSNAGGYKCEVAEFAKFNFTSGKNHKLRLMNIGASAVIANDYMPVEPYNVSMIALAVGQRADVIIYGSGKKGEKYWMRSNIVACSINDGILTEALAPVYYEEADTKTLPTASPNTGPTADTSPRSCGNDPLPVTRPTFPLKASEPGVTKQYDIRVKSNGTHMLMYMGDQSFRVDYNAPILQSALSGNANSYRPERNVLNMGTAKTARVVIYNHDNSPHPFHLHGHNMQVLALGMGKWDGTVVKPENPQRRDVQLMPPGTEAVPSFLVLQWDADNPGVWPLHCHFSFHSSMGLVINIIESPELIPLNLARAIKELASNGPTCAHWNAWTKKIGHLATGLDSGL